MSGTLLLAQCFRNLHYYLYQECKTVEYNHTDCVLNYYIQLIIFVFVLPYQTIKVFRDIYNDRPYKALFNLALFTMFLMFF